jgi:hypothetical protein
MLVRQRARERQPSDAVRERLIEAEILSCGTD